MKYSHSFCSPGIASWVSSATTLPAAVRSRPGSTTAVPGTLTLRAATRRGPTSRGVWRTKKRLVWVDLFFSGVELYTTTITITIRRLFHLGCTAMYNWSNDLVMANKCFVGGNCFYQSWQWLPTNHSLWQKVRWIEFWWIRVTVQRGYLSPL